MNRRALVGLTVTLVLCTAIAGYAQALTPVQVYDLGCDDSAYKWYSLCDDTNGMITEDGPHFLPSGGLWEFGFDGDPGFKSVMVGTSEQYASFTADLRGGAILTIIWTPGYSSIEQLQVTLDGNTLNGRTITASNGSNGQTDAKLGAPGNLWYFTELFEFGPLTAAQHSLAILSLNGDGVGFDYIKLEAIPIEVNIDIKPGSDPNSINLGSNGVIPVAILTTDTFDASTVDPFTVTLAGAEVRVKGKSGNAGSLEDVDGDGDLDLVIQVLNALTLEEGATMAMLEAWTYDGMPVVGYDEIRIVKLE